MHVWITRLLIALVLAALLDTPELASIVLTKLSKLLFQIVINKI